METQAYVMIGKPTMLFLPKITQIFTFSYKTAYISNNKNKTNIVKFEKFSKWK